MPRGNRILVFQHIFKNRESVERIKYKKKRNVQRSEKMQKSIGVKKKNTLIELPRSSSDKRPWFYEQCCCKFPKKQINTKKMKT